MTPIPTKIRNALAAMPRMKMCEMIWHPEFGACDGKIQWHHTFIYANNQVQEVWAILGGCDKHHDMVKKDRRVKEAFERRSLELATSEDLAKYPKKDWQQIIKYLKVEKIYE